jgi:hypothetical protein
VTVRELFHNDGGEGEEGGERAWPAGRGGAAKEVADIPLCANCVLETEVDRVDEGALVQNALRRVDRVDGGLTHSRWEKRQGVASQRVPGTVHKVLNKVSTSARLPEEQHSAKVSRDQPRSSRLILQTGPVLDGAESDDGEGKGEKQVEGGGGCLVPLDSMIYISILDPMGKPAFKPSRTKPIPRWMQMSPSQRPAQRRPRSILDDHFRDVSAASAVPLVPRMSNNVCPTNPVASSLRLFAPPPHNRRGLQTRGLSMEEEGEYDAFDSRVLPEITVTLPRGHNVSFVTEQPLKRPSSRAQASYTVSQGIQLPRKTVSLTLDCHHSPEHADPVPRYPHNALDVSRPSERRGLGPYPQGTLVTLRSPDHEVIGDGRSSSPTLTEDVMLQVVKTKRTPPPQSREYLNLYRPATSSTRERRDEEKAYRGGNGIGSPSIAVSGRRKARELEGAQVARDLMRRVAEKVQADEARGEEMEEREKRRKRSLQEELKKLFRGAL